MTSASKDFFINNNNFKTERGSINGFKYTMDNDNLSQELQYKMSKKIAQLTKVIYALNTRNDDNEAVVNQLEARHQQELEEITSKVKTQIESLDSKVQNLELEKQKLENSSKNFEMKWKDIKMEFEYYKKSEEDKSKVKSEQHLEELESMNNQVKSLQFSYEDILRNLNDLHMKEAQNKSTIIRDMELQNQSALDLLRQDFQKKEEHWKNVLNGNQKKLEEDYKIAQNQIDELNSNLISQKQEFQVLLRKKDQDIELIQSNKQRIIQDYEDQIKQMKKDHEAAIAQTNSQGEKIAEFEREELKIKIQEIQQQCLEKERNYKSDIHDLMNELKQKEASLKDLEHKLSEYSLKREGSDIKNAELNKNLTEAKSNIKKLESELSGKNKSLVDLEKKIGQLDLNLESKKKELQDSKSSNDKLSEKYLKLQQEHRDLANELRTLREESIAQQSNFTKSTEVDYQIQLQSLTRGLETMQKEYNEIKLANENLRANHELEITQKLKHMQKDGESELDKLAKKFEKENKIRETNNSEEVKRIKNEYLGKIDEERKKGSKMMEKVRGELELLKSDSANKLKQKDKELANWNTMLEDKDKELRSMELQIKTLKESLSELKKKQQDLTKVVTFRDKEIVELKDLLNAKDAEVLQQKASVEKAKKSIQVQEDLTEKYNKLSVELDRKWGDTMRKENGRIRNEMLETFGKEKQKIIDQLQMKHREQMDVVSRQIQQLEDQQKQQEQSHQLEISQLEVQLEFEKKDMTKSSDDKVISMKHQLEELRRQHTSQLDRIQKEHQMKCDKLTDQLQQQNSQNIQQMNDLLQENESSWKERHESALHNLMIEHDRQMKIKLDELANQHRNELNQYVHSQEEEAHRDRRNIEESMQKEIQNLKNKIQLMQKQIESEHSNHLTELDKVSSAKHSLSDHSRQMQSQLQQTIKERDEYKRQITDLTQDLNYNHKNTEEKLKLKEFEWQKYYDQIIQKMKHQYDEDSKQTYGDFTRAQNLLKDKIKELNRKLLEAESNFMTRPSRDEDLELIQTLQAQLKGCQREIEKLTEEKKYFQLELVNRETNFNKIFTPLNNSSNNTNNNKNRKLSVDKVKTITKLSPLPGSPFHDEPINPNKPISNRLSIDLPN